VTAFAAVSDLEAVLGVTFSAQEATAANLVLLGVSAAIRRYTRQTVDLVTNDVAVLQGTWSRELVLPQWPVVSVSNVLINSGQVAAGTWFLTGNNKLYRGYLPIFNGPDDWGGDLFLSSWLGPISTVQVTYTHGFAVIPDDLKLTTVKVAARIFGNPTGDAREQIGGTRTGYKVDYGATNLTKDEQAEVDWLRTDL